MVLGHHQNQNQKNAETKMAPDPLGDHPQLLGLRRALGVVSAEVPSDQWPAGKPIGSWMMFLFAKHLSALKKQHETKFAIGSFTKLEVS